MTWGIKRVENPIPLGYNHSQYSTLKWDSRCYHVETKMVPTIELNWIELSSPQQLELAQQQTDWQ
jgi:hypothetical protein